MSKFNLLVAQSGGPTVAINSSLAGVVSGAINCDMYDRVYGSLNGILGILEDRITDLTKLVENNPDTLNCLKHTPAMYLGSCRYKLPGHRLRKNVLILFSNSLKNITLVLSFILAVTIQWILL